MISIGNITCGGTGKTPITIDLAKRFSNAGHKVGILTRGYKRRYTDDFVVAGNGKGAFARCEHSGDEPLMIAKAVPRAVVIVGTNRSIAAQIAIKQYGCDLLLLDDGFQHFKIDRDIDMVLLDYADEPEHDALLPAGRLREPLVALSRATAVIITKVPAFASLERLDYLRYIIRKYAPHADIGTVRFQPSRLNTFDGKHLEIKELTGQSIYAFCGIARPESFFQLLLDCESNIIKTRTFPDHHWYSSKDLAILEQDFARSGADLLVTTAKDLVKLDLPSSLRSNALAVELETEWIDEIPGCIQPYNVINTRKQKSGHLNEHLTTSSICESTHV